MTETAAFRWFLHASNIGFLLFVSTGTVVADDLTIPNTFQASTPARAADVNENFAAVEASVDDNALTIQDNAEKTGINFAAIQTNSAEIASNKASIETNQSQVDADILALQQQINDLPASGEPICFDYSYPIGGQFRDRATGVITTRTIISIGRNSQTLYLYYYERGGTAASSNIPYESVQLNEGLSAHPIYDAVCVTVMR